MPKRTSAIPTTSTLPKRGYYLGQDPAAGVTEKLNAGVLLDLLNGREPRQGLVLAGTAGATVTGLPAFGTDNFTFAVCAQLDGTLINYRDFFSGPAGSFYGYVGVNGQIIVDKAGIGTVLTTPNGSVVVGETSCYTFTRTGGTLSVYKDGVVLASAADANDYTA
ncbi:MAG: hypothetical protein AAB368_16740, partial [bacterium]